MSVFLFVAQLLSAFCLRKAVDEEGVDTCIQPQLKITPGTTSKILDFSHEIFPRNTKSVEFIRRLGVEHCQEGGDSGFNTLLFSGIIQLEMAIFFSLPSALFPLYL